MPFRPRMWQKQVKCMPHHPRNDVDEFHLSLVIPVPCAKNFPVPCAKNFAIGTSPRNPFPCHSRERLLTSVSGVSILVRIICHALLGRLCSALSRTFGLISARR